MIKSWHLHKSDHKFDITINGVNANGIDAEIQIDNDKTVEIDEIKGNIIKFKWYVRIADTSYLGVRFNDFEGQEEKFAELTNYYNSLKDKQKELHDAEYNAILSGKKTLDYYHEEGEHCSGDVVYGISAEVVRDLHCGRYIDGFGTVIDYELQGSDISVMKKHYEEWSKQQAAIKAERERKIKEFEEEKAKMLKGVQWDIEEHSLCDEGGNTKYYIHTITINDETYVFQERNIFDFGRVINPCYSISPGIESGGIMLRDDDGYYWSHSKGDKAIRITVTDTELHAYQIVAKYGKFVKAGIRM